MCCLMLAVQGPHYWEVARDSLVISVSAWLVAIALLAVWVLARCSLGHDNSSITGILGPPGMNSCLTTRSAAFIVYLV